MPALPPPPLPSEAELNILRVLWTRGAATAKEIHEELNAGVKPPRVVTTTAKLLQIMLGKRLVSRDETTWPHTYWARAAEAAVMQGLAARTLTNVFNRSASQFMLHALDTGSVSSAEIEQIKALLETYEKDNSRD